MPDYEAMNRELPKLKGALTRAKKRGPVEVLETVATALERFGVIGWPDSWSTWTIAADDAQADIRYGLVDLLTEREAQRARAAVETIERLRHPFRP